jgi:hypothetical protein
MSALQSTLACRVRGSVRRSLLGLGGVTINLECFQLYHQFPKEINFSSLTSVLGGEEVGPPENVTSREEGGNSWVPASEQNSGRNVVATGISATLISRSAVV